MPSPELTAYLPQIRSMPLVMPDDIATAARVQNAHVETLYPPLKTVRTESAALGGSAALWYRHGETPTAAAIVYFHGGGFMWSSAAAHGGLISRIVAAAGIDAVALDYGLAPGTVFPGQIEQGLALYRGLLDSGYDANAIAFCGDSAGAGLALSVMLAARDAGLSQPACITLASAYVDLTNAGESIDWIGDDPCVHRGGLELCRDTYLAGHDPNDPAASPLFAALDGLPPTLIQVGARERLLSDSTRLAGKLREAGVEVALEVYDGCFHLWHWLVPDAPESRAAVSAIAQFVKTHLGQAR